MRKQFNLLKQFGSVARTQDATDLLSEDLVQVEQRVEPTRRAAQVIHKKLTACLQSQLGFDADKRTKKLPLMMLSLSMAECLKDFDGDSPIRRVLEMCCFMQTLLAKTLADYEVQMEKEVLEPLYKLSEDDLPEILKNKKQFTKLTTDWTNARSRSHTSSGAQAKQDGLREEVEEAWRRLESIKDQYSADLYHFATKEEDYASYFLRLLELQADYHKMSLGYLEKNITELKETNNSAAPRLSVCGHRVYGQPLLSHLAESERSIATPIEECVQMLLQTGMQEEGLFRLAAAASVVKQLKSSLDSGSVDHTQFSSDPHAVAGALKSYLRELPEPLMTFELYDEWFKAAGEKEGSELLVKLRETLAKLPKENYRNLRYLVQFLARLSQHQAVNRMTPSNIAIVLGPNLLWPKAEGEGLTLDMASASSVQVVTVIEPLIQHAAVLFPEEEDFTLPDLLLDHVKEDVPASGSFPSLVPNDSQTPPNLRQDPQPAPRKALTQDPPNAQHTAAERGQCPVPCELSLGLQAPAGVGAIPPPKATRMSLSEKPQSSQVPPAATRWSLPTYRAHKPPAPAPPSASAPPTSIPPQVTFKPQHQQDSKVAPRKNTKAPAFPPPKPPPVSTKHLSVPSE